jgi:hypothetical protein
MQTSVTQLAMQTSVTKMCHPERSCSRLLRAAESKDLRLLLQLPVSLFVISQRSGEICFYNPHSQEAA